MTGKTLWTAVLTGMFCTVFSLFISWFSAVFGVGQIIGISFISGFIGSLFGQTVTRRWQKVDE